MFRIVQAMHTTTGAEVTTRVKGRGITATQNKKSNSIADMKKMLEGRGINSTKKK